MRQVFTSPRLENVEGVAKLLEDAGIEVRITNGRSYKGKLRGDFSYRDDGTRGPQPAIWIVKSEDQPKARRILRERGLMDSSRADSTSYVAPTFRDVEAMTELRTPKQRAFKLKIGVLLAIAAIVALIMVQTLGRDKTPAAAAKAPVAAKPGAPAIAPLPEALARVVFAKEISAGDAAVVCLAVDGKDASPTLVAAFSQPGIDIVPMSQCIRVAREGFGSYERATGRKAMLAEVQSFRPSKPDLGQVQFSAYRHRQRADYKTLEVTRIGGQWRVVRTLKHIGI